MTTDKFMDLAPTTEVTRDADDPGEAMIVSHAFPVSIAYAIFPRCVMDFVACVICWCLQRQGSSRW